MESKTSGYETWQRLKRTKLCKKEVTRGSRDAQGRAGDYKAQNKRGGKGSGKNAKEGACKKPTTARNTGAPKKARKNSCPCR